MKWSLFTFFLSSVFASNAQVTSAYVDSVVNASLKELPQAGIAVAVVKDGKVIHSEGYGLASVKTEEKVNDKTLFSIASNSKAFTTCALGMLVDEGKLSWTDYVVDIIPEFKTYDPYVTEHFMIVDLITHRSGMDLGAGDLMFIPDGSDFTVEDVITSFQYQEPTSEFRTKYDYNNLMFITAGEVIHRVSGKTWDAFVEERIMKPLGMKHAAGYRENLKSTKNVAEPHSSVGGDVIQLDAYNDPNKVFGAAGGIYASVDDLSKWMLFNLNHGVVGKDTLLSPGTHAKMWEAQTMMAFSAMGVGVYNNHYRAYGLGWSLKDENGYTIVSHTGGMPGMLSHTILIPELNAGIVVLTNAAPGGYSFISVANEIKDVFIGAKDTDWIGRMKAYIDYSEMEADSVVMSVWDQTVENMVNGVTANPDDFVGTYKDNWFGEISIEKRNDELWFVSKRSPRLSGKMHYYEEGTFAIAWEYDEMDCNAFAIFEMDGNGKAAEISMKGISPDIDFSFDFQHLHFTRVK